MTSSRGSIPPPYEAVVRRGDREIGPVRLPLDEPEQFIHDFNQVYQGHEMSVIAKPMVAGSAGLVKSTVMKPLTAINGVEQSPENGKSS